MKKIIWLFLAVMLAFLPVSAQDEEWRTNFFDDFDDNSFGWPLGTDAQGSVMIERSIQHSDYVWNISTADPNVYWMGLNIMAPAGDIRSRFTAEVRLPEFEPLACGGLMLEGQGDSFYAYVVCNDKTYSLIRSNHGSVETLIPYSQIKDYDSFSASSISAEISNGWVDLYFNGVSLDTYNIGSGGGRFGLVAMPESSLPTEIAFGAVAFQSTDTASEGTFQADAVDPNASDGINRLVKMLNMKERIASTAGVYRRLPDHEEALAMMGYAAKAPLGITGGNLLLQSDIAWASGYERPDYANSGCGFYIRESASNSYIEIFAAMDGGVYVNAWRYGSFVPLITLKYSTWSVEGSGRLAIAADAQKITVLWNDSILGTITDATWVGGGEAGYLVHSGTNGGFGTKCTFSNGEAYLFSGE